MQAFCNEALLWKELQHPSIMPVYGIDNDSFPQIRLIAPWMAKGDILGQEAIGIVEEVGPEVTSLKAGDRVIILPVIACGKCDFCIRQEYSLCDMTNPCPEMEALYGQRLSGILGYSKLCGGYPGDQAEYCRVPNADLTCVKAPREIDARKILGLTNVIIALRGRSPQDTVSAVLPVRVRS